MIGQHACHHRLGHRRGAQADARVMPALGAQFDLAAELVDAAYRVEDRAGRLDRQPADDVLAGRDAAPDPPGMFARNTGWPPLMRISSAFCSPLIAAVAK